MTIENENLTAIVSLLSDYCIIQSIVTIFMSFAILLAIDHFDVVITELQRYEFAVGFYWTAVLFAMLHIILLVWRDGDTKFIFIPMFIATAKK